VRVEFHCGKQKFLCGYAIYCEGWVSLCGGHVSPRQRVIFCEGRVLVTWDEFYVAGRLWNSPIDLFLIDIPLLQILYASCPIIYEDAEHVFHLQAVYISQYSC
jgi:hypothetical protein